MPGRRPVDVRYRTAADNGVQRLVLFTVWKARCHACEKPLLFVDTQIDHIIPRTSLVGGDR